jgi:hypothetical protein
MSDKWETVGKSKPAAKGTGGGGGKAANGNTKKVIRPLPRLEDVLSKNSLDNIYVTGFDESPPSPKVSPKKEKKETQKPDPAKKTAAAKKEEKPRMPTTLQEAVKVGKTYFDDSENDLISLSRQFNRTKNRKYKINQWKWGK